MPKFSGCTFNFGPMAELFDTFQRKHDYLRISLTDRCDLRCTYCMPEHPLFAKRNELMTPDEIETIGKIFVNDYGINKIRLTGGEPLVRKEASEIIDRLAALDVDLAITTNALSLESFLDQFERVGLKSINISLDTLKADRFKAIARRDGLEKVLANMNTAIDRGFHVKLNVVVMRDVNTDEINDMVRLTMDSPIHVRFIEFMPFDGNGWKMDKVLSYAEMLDIIGNVFPIEKLHDHPNSTSKAHRVKDALGTFSVISTVSQPFCTGCNRIRLTAEGRIRNCLFAKVETDLLSTLRAGGDIRPLIEKSINGKHKMLGGLPELQNLEASNEAISDRSMVRIGG